MVNHKAVYFNVENFSFPLGMILHWVINILDNLATLAEMLVVSASLLFFLNHGEIVTRCRRFR